ncbi:opacity protein-like surface antigen [Novosphingobium kunmingense]|uniref:Opacity protein-like surface antigen n=1 Tax=Novosphingobium kunmingense TaxID=1211806 RepID=A0A2N0H2X4_9SPHN|nr:outer membrane beta-barrel protein [Novosphingobium kunmingense]PKB13293.1 opacity protein-like surface antigen [Novosphingobium kunmingense]
MKLATLSLVTALTAATPAFAEESPYFGGATVGVVASASRLSTSQTDFQNWYFALDGARLEDDAVMGGFSAGYDVISGNLLVGVEGDVLFGTADSTREVVPSLVSYEIGSRITKLATARAKLGVTSGRMAGYLTGGLAISDARQRYFETDGTGQNFSGKGDRTGWILGLGFDYAISPRASIGLAASHADFGAVHHILQESNGTPSNCTWARSPDGLCHWNVKDRLESVSVKVRYRL